MWMIVLFIIQENVWSYDPPNGPVTLLVQNDRYWVVICYTPPPPGGLKNWGGGHKITAPKNVGGGGS